MEQKEQDFIKAKFEEISKEVEELIKDVASLKKPLELKVDMGKVEEVRKDQEDVMDELSKQPNGDKSSFENVKSKQKSAAKR